jgi:hypothetical protein
MKFILIATFLAATGQEPVQLAKFTPSLSDCLKAAQTWVDYAKARGDSITSISCSGLLEPKQ